MKLTLTLALSSACIYTVFAASVTGFDTNVTKGLRLIQTSEHTAPFWVTEPEKLDLIRQHKHFFDLTDTYHEEQEHKARSTQGVVERASYPAPSKSTQVKSIITALSTSRMTSLLSTLTAFNTRYYKSPTGEQASTWMYKQLVSIANGTNGVTVSKFRHPWTQFSVIAKFNGVSPTADAVIIGAHIDSINRDSPQSGRAPGADDNGTGVVNLMEVFRALVATKFAPSRPVEFHFYSAEEVGLLGSKAIATSYKTAGKGVYAMINFDMTGFFKPGSKEVIVLIDDNVDAGLTAYVRSLIATYCSLPAVTESCGYACSDHASWTSAGYPSAHPFEALNATSNKKIHTSGDITSVQGFNWTHSLEFAKIAVAATVELGSV